MHTPARTFPAVEPTNGDAGTDLLRRQFAEGLKRARIVSISDDEVSFVIAGGAPGAQQTELLKSVADSAGDALERVWAGEDRRGAQQAALVRAAKSLNRSLEIEQVLSTLCEEVAAALGAEKAAAYLGNEADGYTAVGIAGLPESFRGFKRGPDKGLGARAVRDGRPVISEDYRGEGLAPAASSALDDVRTALAVPLRWDDRARGSLSVGFTAERRLDAEEVELVEGFAELASLACTNAERHAAVRESADQDQLTGCLNQGAFRRALRAWIAIAERDEGPLSLALVDLDSFKAVNDTAGHPAGDSVLREVGSTLMSELRDDDTVARYGGDEFAVILPGLGRDVAEPVIVRLVASLGGIALPDDSRLSGCAGIASWQPGEDAQGLIDRTDAALLEAKRAGSSSTVFNARPAEIAEPGERGATSLDLPDSRRRRELGDRLQALAGRIGLRISREDEIADAARVAVDELGAALEATECIVVRVGEDGIAETLASYLRAEASPSPGLDATRSGSTIRRSLRRRAPIAGDELAIPVLAGGELWGALGCRAQSGGLGSEDARLAEAVADHLGTTMRALELRDEVRELRARAAAGSR